MKNSLKDKGNESKLSTEQVPATSQEKPQTQTGESIVVRWGPTYGGKKPPKKFGW